MGAREGRRGEERGGEGRRGEERGEDGRRGERREATGTVTRKSPLAVKFKLTHLCKHLDKTI